MPVVCAADRKIVNPSISTSNNRIIQDQDGDSQNDYLFDTSGNTTKDAMGRTFIYDAENKQIEVKDSQNNTIGQYFYDGDGKRVKKYVPSTGETTIFIYDASSKLVAEYSTEVTPQQDAKVSYLTTDHLGSPRINTDQNGLVTARHDYQPFGEEIQRASYGADAVRQGFTGYEKDRETDLDFAQARMYASGLGRFTRPDDFLNDTTQLNPASWNLYVYVRNNPIQFTDPTGEIVYVDGLGKDLDKFLSDLNYTYGCDNCVTTKKDNDGNTILDIDISAIDKNVLDAADFITDAITKSDYEVSVFSVNSDKVGFGRGAKNYVDGKGGKKIDAILLDFKDRDFLIGSKDARDAFAKLTFAHELAHLYLGLKDPPLTKDSKDKTGDVVDRTNKISAARGILQRGNYYYQTDNASGQYAQIKMGQFKVKGKKKEPNFEQKKLVEWNTSLIKEIN